RRGDCAADGRGSAEGCPSRGSTARPPHPSVRGRPPATRAWPGEGRHAGGSAPGGRSRPDPLGGGGRPHLTGAHGAAARGRRRPRGEAAGPLDRAPRGTPADLVVADPLGRLRRDPAGPRRPRRLAAGPLLGVALPGDSDEVVPGPPPVAGATDRPQVVRV